jgi:hypothetical protein
MTNNPTRRRRRNSSFFRMKKYTFSITKRINAIIVARDFVYFLNELYFIL